MATHRIFALVAAVFLVISATDPRAQTSDLIVEKKFFTLPTYTRFHLHFTPTSASWLNMVERFFAEIIQLPPSPDFRCRPGDERTAE
jgi:hypothetical protein